MVTEACAILLVYPPCVRKISVRILSQGGTFSARVSNPLLFSYDSRCASCGYCPCTDNLLSVENVSLKRRRPSVWGRTRITVKKLSRDNLFYYSKHEAAGSEGGGAKLTKGTLSTAFFTLHALYTQDYLQAAPCLSLLQQPLPCGSQVITLPLESLHPGDLLRAAQFRLGLLG